MSDLTRAYAALRKAHLDARSRGFSGLPPELLSRLDSLTKPQVDQAFAYLRQPGGQKLSDKQLSYLLDLYGGLGNVTREQEARLRGLSMEAARAEIAELLKNKPERHRKPKAQPQEAEHLEWYQLDYNGLAHHFEMFWDRRDELEPALRRKTPPAYRDVVMEAWEEFCRRKAVAGLDNVIPFPLRKAV